MPSTTTILSSALPHTAGSTTISDRPVKPDIQQYIAEEPLNNPSYKSISIHQDAARTANESSSSRLLNGRPLTIATVEQTLPRKIRTILEQLHTGHSRILGQYINIIDLIARSHCHDCGQFAS